MLSQSKAATASQVKSVRVLLEVEYEDGTIGVLESGQHRPDDSSIDAVHDAACLAGSKVLLAYKKTGSLNLYAQLNKSFVGPDASLN